MTIIAISGFSGAGKSLIGKELAKLLQYNYIDIDDYFIPSKDKPRIKLSDGTVTVNFDSLEALDITKFKRECKKLAADGNLIITGFTLRRDVLAFKPDHHIHLLVDKKLAIERRWKAKPFFKKDPNKQKRDLLMINEVAYPFYLDTLANSDIDKFFDANLPFPKVYEKIKEYLNI
jgi:shikimate kinase